MIHLYSKATFNRTDEVIKLIKINEDLVEALKCAVVDSECILTKSDRKRRAVYYRQAINRAEREDKS